MPPILFLLAALGLTAAAAVVDAALRRARSARVAALAADCKLRFTPLDRFQLTPRVAARFPIPGAADIVIRNLVYGQEPAGGFRYVFTVEYTLGVLRTKRRRASAAMLVEAPPNATDRQSFSPVKLALDDQPLIAQYRQLLETGNASPLAASRADTLLTSHSTTTPPDSPPARSDPAQT